MKINSERLYQVAESFRHARFKENGRSLEEGIDCLGFLVLFYKEFGIHIPDGDGKPIEKRWYVDDPERYVRGIKSLGKGDVPIDELKTLDLVYFAIKRNIITHAGIMLDDEYFIHMSPSRGISIDSLKRHWRKFRGAIRMVE
ncbi:C40 family peptidase [Alkaliphilus serpentinus]|uniref:NlpC/P60 family protein n=1 Tax=Alkaliphilus serpentinus TaxID=1482731 RepID=A0A833HQ59_9FIRM|nr:NlpC/P60 family protein [Alkaliphilus serpentinus]KAB3531514.1 NlpC/P60 family protein [Alkaliphilus serpentinus]